MTNPQDEMGEIEEYGDTGIRSMDAPVPYWLIATIIILPIWGVISFFIFWNGSTGWFDRGHWHALQQAANTTYPQIRESKDQFDN